ncbi:MAG: helix-turn-helix transcriptional regulator [Haloferacaceae archaeon]
MVGVDGRTGVVLAAVILLAAVAPAAAADSAHARQSALASTQVDADGVLLAVDVGADGDATWRVAYRIQLDDQNTTAAYESLQQDVREHPENYTDTFRDRMGRTAQAAENATGRQMAVRNVSVTAEKQSLPQGSYGVVTYRFTWTNFAVVEGPRLRVGDALAGLFLDEQTTLLLSWPDGYHVVSVAPQSSAQVGTDRVTWEGPLEFVEDEPSVVLTSAPATTTPGGESGGFPLTSVVAGLLALGLGAAVAYLYASGRLGGSGGDDAAVGSAGGDGGGGAGDSAAARGGDGASGAAPGEEAAESAATAEATADATAADESPDGSEGPPPELLSNEEQVLRLLDQRGGRMKQQQIVAELDWTEAKTSQVIGDLRDEGEIETFRIGRENVVTLPEEDEL